MKVINQMIPEPLQSKVLMNPSKDELVDKWGLKTYSRYTRGFYFSFKMELDALVFEAEKSRKKAKMAYLKKKEDEARLKALERIKIMGF